MRGSGVRGHGMGEICQGRVFEAGSGGGRCGRW